ncbi:MAG: DUF697 domain-containing protein [FCB group bacterium]|nr:DUF697 domain-containing protein [FCB group bacterium]MBL7027852.1 DUF697 domain-containing protein [Candidatus Neomarinimicrobiota bacterium]MBL7120933.1 DUF697 domain-containing protein [Candidatus Neomarinimicrobiota bacterium]
MLKRLILFVIALFAYLILREMLNFYVLAYTANPYLGYLVLAILISVLIYFVVIPLYRISRLSGDPGPVRKKRKEAELMEMRIQRRMGNKLLSETGYILPQTGTVQERYDSSGIELSQRCDEIRRKYVVHLFYSSAVSQYGFIDAILIFSANVNLVKEIFTLYTGRATGRDLWQIMKQIYYSVAIGGSEGVEFAVEELISKMGTDTLKSIPFFDKVMVSLASGFTNAVLLSRISLITENYCRMTYIESTKDLSPDPMQILDSTKAIVEEPIRHIKKQLNDIAKQKAIDFSRYAINPTRTVIEKALDKFRSQPDDEETRSVKRSIAIGLNPLKYFSIRRLRKSKK